MERNATNGTAIGTEGEGASGGRRRLTPTLRLAATFVAILLLLLCTYWFLAGDHRVDRILSFGLPDPSGASGHRGYWSSTAWLFTALGSVEVVFVLASALVLFLLLAGRLKGAVTAVVAIAGGAAAGYAAKFVTGYFRPHHPPDSIEMLNTSFPSGHALLATLLVGTAALLTARSAASPTAKASAWTAAIFLAVAVGLSRIYLGTHWPSDVLAGWTFGILWLAATERSIGRL